jgi:cytochrome c-type biogenesis protein CcmH
MHRTFYLSKHSTTHSPRVRRDSESGISYLPMLAILAIMSIAVGLYMTIGRPDLAVESEQTQAAQPTPRATTGQDVSVATVESLLSGLEQRLQREPEDGKGWLLLAKSYDHLGRTAEAIEAYTRAREFGNSDLLLESRLVKTAFESDSKGQPGNGASSPAVEPPAK